jgi:hypothetical protein
MGGDHFPFIQWTFSILTINIETPQNLKNIEQMHCEIKVPMYDFTICYFGSCESFKVHHGLAFDYFGVIFFIVVIFDVLTSHNWIPFGYILEKNWISTQNHLMKPIKTTSIISIKVLHRLQSPFKIIHVVVVNFHIHT